MLYIVPTPIGNLRDITFRAVDVLKSADLILCEDTRQTQKLLNHYEIIKPTVSFHEYSKPGKIEKFIAHIERGDTLALVTDSGMPLISDPGFELVHAALQKNMRVEVLPGPSAFVTALAASGLAVDSFSFFGFLSQKSASRKKFLTSLIDREETLIFYESPYRLDKVLEEMKAIFGDREAVVAREMTKKFEEFVRGKFTDLIARFTAKKVLGEIVILVSGKRKKIGFMRHLAFFVSGNGTNMENLIVACHNGIIPAEANLVICDNPGVRAIERAKNQGVHTVVVDRKQFKDKASFEAEIIKHLDARKIDLIVLAGFMRILSGDFVKKYWGKLVNIHPSLLPAFPGAHGIKDAFDAKVPETGVTVHFVDEGVDSGAVISQKKVKVDPSDTLEMLETKVHAVEYEIYPEALKLVLTGKAKPR